MFSLMPEFPILSLKSRRTVAAASIGVLLGTLVLSGGVVAKPAPAEHLNPSHKDPTQELIRLRTEGVAHFESGIAQKKALAVFTEALTLPGANAVDRYNLGVINKKLNKVEESKKHLLEAIKLDKGLAHPHYLLGLIYVTEENRDAALKSFAEAVRLQPGEASAHYQLSRVYREAGNTQGALQSIVETLRLDPYHTGAMYQLYLHHQQGGDKEKAKLIFKEFSRLKKALGQTRKEINPDESVLARPINYPLAQLETPFSAIDTVPSFRLESLKKLGDVSNFSIADVNNDKTQDIVVASGSGDVAVWLNEGKKGFSLHAKGNTGANLGDIDSLELVKFSRGNEYSVLLSSDIGLNHIALENANPEPKDPKAKHHNAKNQELKPIAVKVGGLNTLSKVKPKMLNLADVDHDGDTDIITDGFQRVWLNRGNAQFDTQDNYLPEQDMKQLAGMTRAMLGTDFRNQIAVDFVAQDKNQKRWLLRDDMGGRYELFDDRLPSHKKVHWFERSDMNNDGLVDVVNLTSKGLVIDYNKSNLNFDSQRVSKRLSGVSEAIILDFNNDGHKDVVYALDSGEVNVFINLGKKRYKNVQVADLKTSSPIKKMQAIDSNDDGLVDIVAVDSNGELMVMNNSTQTKNAKWLTLKLDGIRSAPDGRYTQVEVRYGGFYSKYEAEGDLVHIPIGQASHAELLRITWPNGFVENKFNIQPEVTWYFAESERISGSCPSVYAWNGERYVYITDAFISGPMGVPTGPGQYFPVGDDEYVKIPGEHMRVDENGNYRVSIVEELKEVTYLDDIRLYAVDYPESYYMFPNEYLMPPKFPEFKLHMSNTAKAPFYAADHLGNDVTDLVKDVDYRYPHDFNRLDFTGFADPNGVEIELTSEQMASEDLRLFLTGWFYYFDSSSLIAASQQPDVELIWPQIQGYQDGEWRFLKRIGIPSGKEKTVVVDLGGQIPEGVEKIRVWTNVELYWDRILVDTAPEPSTEVYQMNQLATEDTRLRFHGFSTLIRPEGEFPMPDRFDYHKTRYQSLWNPLKGKYTRYGEVDSLVNKVDGKFAVFSAGDELAMTFDAADLPPLRKGYKRDFLIYLNGFVKDGDKYTAHAGSVDPMPFAGLKSYPYSEKESAVADFDSDDYQQYLREYQSREPLRFTGPEASSSNDPSSN